MNKRYVLTLVALFLVFLGPELAQQSPTAQSTDETKFFPLLEVEDIDESLPEMQIEGQTFRVVVHKKRLVWPPDAHHSIDPDDDESAQYLEVRDASNTVVFKDGMDSDLSEDELREIHETGRFGFSDSYYVSRVQGRRNQAMLISLSTLPSAPDSCAEFRMLGLFDRKLVPFSEPFCEDLVFDESDGASLRLRSDTQTSFEFFKVRRNLGYFRVLIPVQVDFLQARLLPGEWCIRLHAPADIANYCEFPVDTQRSPASEDTFVRLFPEPDPTATPQHIVVKPGTNVEFLSVLAPNVMDQEGHWLGNQDGELYWLKVRIGNAEGWVRDEEDLQALGLFQAG